MAKALIQSREDGTSCEAMFNPKELSVEKQVSWTPKEGAITDTPPAEFGKPTPATLSVTLYFDTYETKQDVYTTKVKDLETLAMINTELKRPMLCVFVWGSFTFQGVLTSLSQKYTMFLNDGTRVRCECAVQMMAASEADMGNSPSTSGSGSGSSSASSSSSGGDDGS